MECVFYYCVDKESVGGQVERSGLHSIPTSCPPAESPTVWAASAEENKAPFPPHVENIICIISPSVRWKQNNNWFALFSLCVVKQLGINLRITVQLILNAKDDVRGFDAKEGERIRREVTRQRLCVPEELAVFTQRMQAFWSPPLRLLQAWQFSLHLLHSLHCVVWMS